MGRISSVFTIIMMILLTSCTQKVKKNKPLTIAMELQFPPFEMTDGMGEPTGISVEMAKALGQYLGREVKIENTAWTGLIPSLQTGKADLVISSMSITEEREKVVDFSVPYAQSGLALLLYKDSSVNSWDDINREGVVVVVKSGTTGAILARKVLDKAEVRFLEEPAACILEVSQGKADAYIYDAITVFESHKKHKETTKINISNIPNTASPWGVAIKKGNKELLKKVNDFILHFRKNGGFAKLEKKYLGEMKAEFEKAGVPSFFEL